ncbi:MULTISPECIES: DNA mismatch repair endonuclease MutL [Anaerostipes]|uniref:DNA mismatch repair endonuclease MutL n=1 Tax=Anaerostipes TaxID=207244 RepID=UPI0009523744|nr:MULTISPECIES: DNA mismatch repair endonuclease MutL [Anaerostipes]MCI5623729.1 DNA mismatch repair endonuclease MutL [Anaerostipes sp.]OLR58816.1 DNA mismatch repair protein MutL [Anaerostipes sp. 494a]
MAKIQLLDQKTIDNIAAGEVIERPASVVKELVENSIDAKANAITVEIKDGGMTLIRVTDNGCGIPKDQVKTAFLRHATSKIQSVEDLMTVSSLGFRGEALSSISAVAQVELVTKTSEGFSGVSYKIYGGEEEGFSDIGAPDGTTFLVKNLFYNTPARRKFLKSAATEAGYVEQIMVHMALSHPEVSFKFIHNNKNKIYTSGNGNVKDIIYHIYGRDIAGALIPVNGESENVSLSGFAGKPYISRGNRNYESYFINGRYIKSSLIYKAVEEAYKTFTMTHKYPFVCLDIKVRSELLDVNVHPTKMEMRFRNGSEIYDLLVEKIRECLLSQDLIPQVEVVKEKKIEKKTELSQKDKTTSSIQKMPEPFESVRRAKEEQKKSVFAGINYNIQKQSISENMEKTPPVQMTLNETSILEEKARSDRRVIGQLFQTYWLIEFEDQLFIMDQHAAHEKVNYEKLIRDFKNKDIYSQGLEPPMVITVSMTEAEILSKYKDVFAQLGFSIEAFGGNEFCIREVPANLYGLGEKDIFIELLDSISKEHGNTGIEMITNKIASMACKMSVKGNQKMSSWEVEHLLDQLMTLENPYQCPHGRPTIIKMTKYEIEKKFKRII